ncbi:MAG: Zn-dependent hydrolase [Mailhella sp.]|nr:Zn-dependent hydrolase [Mailhella sp.]
MSSITSGTASASRVMARLAELALITEQPGIIMRRYLTPAHKKANELVGRWMEEAGMQVRQDEAGNICGLYPGTDPDAPAVLLGSHLDTVIDAGAYDGCLGVIAAIEAVSILHDQGKHLRHPVRVIGFADEEGTRFGVTYLGSAAVAGLWEEKWLDARDPDGMRMREAMEAFGLDPSAVGMAALPPAGVAAYYEFHIEQGIVLERQNRALAAVTGINGSRRYHMRIRGVTGHAGTIPMSCRTDPMFGAAEVISRIEETARTYGDSLYCTVGYVSCEPNLANCIAGEVDIRLDIRADNATRLAEADERIHAEVRAVCRKRNLGFSDELFFQSRLVKCDPLLVEKVSAALQTVQGCAPRISSGAGRDAAEASIVWPMAMIFLRCREGLSHCPRESITEADALLGVRALVTLLEQNY